jgi:hypothetical protein
MTIENTVYESAVQGRADFRDAFRRERTRADAAENALAEVHAILDREVAGATETLAMDLHQGSRRGAEGWLSAARGIQIAVTKVWPKRVAVPAATPDQVEYLVQVKASGNYDPKTIFARLRAKLRAPSNSF